jgi:hypothetical protein
MNRIRATELVPITLASGETGLINGEGSLSLFQMKQVSLIVQLLMMSSALRYLAGLPMMISV